MPFEIKEPHIKIPLDGHAILIDTDTGTLYVDGNPVNTNIGKVYDKTTAKQENAGQPKRRVKLIESNGSITVIDVGSDGRIFILSFDREQYNTFRGKPKKAYSYWRNAKQGASFYEDDLKSPAWVKEGAP